MALSLKNRISIARKESTTGNTGKTKLVSRFFPRAPSAPRGSNPHSHWQTTLALLALQAAAFWPVWRWYASRITDSSDDAWGWVALLTAAVLLVRFNSESNQQDSTPNLLLPALLTLSYAVSFPFITPLPRALLAMAAIGATLSVYCFRSQFQLSFCGLLLLSLPLMASLQFYLGYPLRSAVAAMAAPMLQLGGLAVFREGTCLNWSGRLISVDAPCSGVKMLWTGMFLCFTLACWFRLSWRRTIAAAALSFTVIVLGNTLRAVALFYLEAGIFQLPERFSEPAHSAVGVMMFLLTAITIAWLNRKAAASKLKTQTGLT